MDLQRTSTLRHVVAALLVFALTVAGMGRSLAGGPDASMPTIRIENLVVPICHAGSGARDPATPGAPAGHDCCDLCALSAPILVPTPPGIAHLVARVRIERRPTEAPGAPRLVRRYDPRQAQGPPAA